MNEFVDGITLRPMSIAGICVDLFIGLLLILMVTRFGRNFYARVETGVARFSERRVLASCVLFFSIVIGRLALLPLIPVPVPGVHDEFSYLLQADTFAHGRLANPPHPMWVSFETFHVNWLPRYASMYPPAQGFVLFIGVLLGHPWIGVLLSDAAMCVAAFWMLLAWMPSRWAFLGALLVALKFGFTSYWMNSYWGGAVAATGGALFLGGLARLVRRASPLNAVLCALGVAILANSRPYEGLFFCLPGALWFVLWLVGKIKSSDSLRARIRHGLVPVCLVMLLTLVFVGCYNWRVTLDPLLLPHELNTRTYYTAPMFLWEHAKPQLQYRNMAFQVFYNGWSRAQYHGTWTDVLKVSREKLQYFQSTFLWPGVQLLLPGLLFILLDRRMWLLYVTSVVAALANLAFIWSNPHYMAPLTCVIYSGLVQSIRHLRTMRVSTLPLGVILARVAFLMLLLSTASHAVYVVSEPASLPSEGNRDRASIVEKLAQLPGKHLVLVRYAELHNPHAEWVFNNADIDNGKVVWARELDPKQNEKLLAYFSDRQVWLVEPDRSPTKISPYKTLQEATKH